MEKTYFYIIYSVNDLKYTYMALIIPTILNENMGKTSIDLIRSHLSTANVYFLFRVPFRPLSINDLKSIENCHD